MKVHQIREQRAAKVTEMRKLVTTAEGEKRSLNAAAQSAFDKLKADVADLEAQETRAQFLEEAERRVAGEPVGDRSAADLQRRVNIVEVLRAQMDGRALTGAAGLPATLAAARAGKRILLANKETLVVSGQLFMDAVHESGAGLFPIDSEHSAIHQSLPAGFNGDLDAAGVKTLWLMASGGPFRTWRREQMANVTPEQAVAHPNWVMGRKISVDSASMMNKGLEVIEARWLFNAQAGQIRVLVHPQSIIHSMVEYRDGSVMAQLGTPDMRTPIAYALGFPERIDAGVPALDLMGSQLQFEAPDLERFPCLQLAFDALTAGGYAPAVLNAANEVAVDAFLNRRCGFADIPRAIAHALAQLPASSPDGLDDLLDADRQARVRAGEFLATKATAA